MSTSLLLPEKPCPGDAGMHCSGQPGVWGHGSCGHPKVYHSTRHIYTVISPRSDGLMVGVNLNPDRHCNFACAYCDVDRGSHGEASEVDLDLLGSELSEVLGMVVSGRIRSHPCYRNVPENLLRLRQVAFSGDGEPTLCPEFDLAVEKVAHLRAVSHSTYFKMVLITNATGLSRPAVQSGLRLFTLSDEVWAKLDVGTQAYMTLVNGMGAELELVLKEIRQLAVRRPVVIQSLFAEINGEAPSWQEVEAYAGRLRELLNDGAMIHEVQIYSASRTPAAPHCNHLPLRSLSSIAQLVRKETGLAARVC